MHLTDPHHDSCQPPTLRPQVLPWRLRLYIRVWLVAITLMGFSFSASMIVARLGESSQGPTECDSGQVVTAISPDGGVTCNAPPPVAINVPSALTLSAPAFKFPAEARPVFFIDGNINAACLDAVRHGGSRSLEWYQPDMFAHVVCRRADETILFDFYAPLILL